MEGTVIIDFFGIPGCGKSKRAHAIAEKLRESGKTVFEPSYSMDHGGMALWRKIKKLFGAGMHYMGSNSEAKALIKLIRSYGYRNVLGQYANIAYKLNAYKRKKNGYIIFDEGFCQAAVSLSVNLNNDARQARECMEKMICSAVYVPVCVNLSTDEALKRLDERKEKNSRVEKETDSEKRRSLLMMYSQAVDSIKFGCEEVEGICWEDDVKFILAQIEKL